MKPARIVGGRFVVEDEPFELGTLASYRAVDPDTFERVVVLEPNKFIVDDEHYLELFQRTVPQLAALAPVGPRVLEVLGRDGVAHAVVTEDIEGITLARMLAGLRASGELLPVEVAMAIVRELVPLFRLPVRLHIGSADVVITPEGHVRAKPELQELQARQIVGAAIHFVDVAVAYLAPEAVRGLPQVTTSDMYTLGVLLYELIANHHPHAPGTDSMFEMLSRIQRSLPPPIQTYRAVPAEVAAFLERAMNRLPDQRFASWDDFLAHLPPLPHARILAAMPEPPEREPPVALGDLSTLPDDGLVPLASRPLVEQHLEPPPRAHVDEYHYGRDHRPMLPSGPLLVDIAPVTSAEYQRFVLEVDGPAALDPEANEWSLTNVSHERARAYAAWAGKRVPSEAEWVRAMHDLGNVHLFCLREWTATPASDGGYVVCGASWRNNDGGDPPSIDHRTVESEPAADLGFRCVQDR